MLFSCAKLLTSYHLFKSVSNTSNICMILVSLIILVSNFTGVVNKVYKREGWKGYTNVTVEGKYNIDIATSFLKVKRQVMFEFFVVCALLYLMLRR